MGWFYQTLFARRKVASAQSLAKKCRSVTPTFCIKLRWWNSPDQCSVCQMPFVKKKLLILFEQKKNRAKMLGKSTPDACSRDQIRSFSSWSKLIRDEKEYSLFHPILKQLKMWSLHRHEWHKYESSYFHSDVVISTKPDGLWQEDNVIKINDFPSRLSNRLRFYLEIGFLFYNRKQ